MTRDTDVLIAGAGTVGLTLALALRRSAPTLRVAVAGDTPAPGAGEDLRASAVAAGARRMLVRLGVWPALAPVAQPIVEMAITDSRTADLARPVFLTFAGEVEPGEPFAHMVPNSKLAAALRAAAVEAGAVFLREALVADFAITGETVTARLADGRTVAAALLIAADGVRSRLRDLAGIPSVGWDYGQSGIVATVEHERPHRGRAEEHFLPAGPFAILPLAGNRSSLVWTEERKRAERLVAGDDLAFRAELELRFGHRLGRLEPVGGRTAHPLGLRLARRLIGPRLALAGDAAHAIHPIAGQGLNLGFKDAAALAETVVEALRLGLDIGAGPVLDRYQRWRRADAVRLALVTDGLNRLFSSDLTPLRLARDIGLGLVDRLPRMKSGFIREAAGLGGEAAPRLLAGAAI